MKLPIDLRPSRCQDDFTPLPSQNNDDRTGYDRHRTEDLATGDAFRAAQENEQNN
jgi:hypothetical protein